MGFPETLSEVHEVKTVVIVTLRHLLFHFVNIYTGDAKVVEGKTAGTLIWIKAMEQNCTSSFCTSDPRAPTVEKLTFI